MSTIITMKIIYILVLQTLSTAVYFLVLVTEGKTLETGLRILAAVMTILYLIAASFAWSLL